MPSRDDVREGGGVCVTAKSALRRAMLRRRRALSAHERRRLSAALCARLIALPQFAGAPGVVGYVATAREIDPAVALSAAAARGARLFYPRAEGNSLALVAVSETTTWRMGPHGIVEPDGNLLLDRDAEAVFVVPGVGFDAHGVRLGHGGGWYDRALSVHRRAFRVGITCDACLLDVVPRDSWDVAMHVVITESRTIVVAAGDAEGRWGKSL